LLGRVWVARQRLEDRHRGCWEWQSGALGLAFLAWSLRLN
jgi:hypothetical protein